MNRRSTFDEPSAGRMRDAVRGLVVWLVMIFVAISAFALVYNFGSIIGSESGLKICRSDCRDFDRLSQFIADRHRPYSSAEAASIVGGGDPHGSEFYRGFVVFVAGVKLVARGAWQPTYAALSCVLAIGVSALATRLLIGSWRASVFTGMFIVLVASNVFILDYSRYLLPDFTYSFLALAALLLAAVGVHSRRRMPTVAAIALSMGLAFWRPHGVILLYVILVVALAGLLIRSEARRWLAALAAVTAGLALFLVIGSITSVAKDSSRFHAIQSVIPPPMDKSLYWITRHNLYGGEESPPLDGSLAIWLVNFPYKESLVHDGSLAAILKGLAYRIPKVFQIHFDTFSRYHNAYRYLYYGAVYIIAASSLLLTLYKRKPNEVVLTFAGLVLAYLIVFVAISHLELRFRLLFDLAAITIASMAAQRVTTYVIGSDGWRARFLRQTIAPASREPAR